MPVPRKPADEVTPGTEQSAENLCPRCSGRGTVDAEPCPACDGTGRITTLVGDA